MVLISFHPAEKDRYMMNSSHDLNIIRAISEIDFNSFDDITIQVIREDSESVVEQFNSSKILVYLNWSFLAQSLETCDRVIIVTSTTKEQFANLEENQDLTPEPESSLSCPSCGKDFQCIKKLRKHMSNAHLDVGCKICGKTFKSRASLKNHQEIHAELSSKLKCDICGKVINQFRNFSQHRMTHFKRNKEFVCKCGKKFAEKMYLSKHMKRCSLTFN